MEELRYQIGLLSKLVGTYQAFAVPRGLLTSFLGARKTRPDDILTLVFTSGSTGTPKGVMLTHENVSSNVAAIAELVNLTSEDVLNRILGVTEEGGLRAAVTAVPDLRKGERLVVVHTPMNEEPRMLREALAHEGLPNLYIPSLDSWCEVPEIPVLGTGKLALEELREIALEHVGARQRASRE